MNFKMILVLAISATTMFSEGCALSVNGTPINLGALAAGGLPQAPLGTGQVDPNALGQTQGALTGSLASGLPQDASAATVPGLTANSPTFTPAAPQTSPASPSTTPVDPNATTPQALAGAPLATPVGTGPIDPASLPTLPAASLDNTLALAGAIPQVPGL